MAHLCIKPACPDTCVCCNHAISDADVRRYAVNYAYLREKPLTTVNDGGVFVGRTPDNVVLNGDDLDAAIRAEMEDDHDRLP